MINFFRKIRKQLADDNKPLKYLRYAIGEILLVVVGILIALSINNWNEERKEKTLEIQILNEVKSNLQSGLRILDTSLKVDSSLTKSGLIIIEHLKNDLKYHDSLLSHFNRFTSIWTVGIPSSGYETLKSKGITLLTNDSIRIKISNLYDNSFPVLSEEQRLDVGMRRREIYNSELYEHFLKRNVVFGDSLEGREPINYNELIKDKRFESMVRSIVINRIWFMGQKEGRKNEIQDLITLINKDLENR